MINFYRAGILFDNLFYWVHAAQNDRSRPEKSMVSIILVAVFYLL